MADRGCKAIISTVVAGVWLASAGPAGAQVEDRPYRPCDLSGLDMAGRGLQAGTLWPDGVVYYRFDSNVSTAQRQVALDVMAELEGICDVDFIERTLSIQVNYITFRDSSVNQSPIGMQGGSQVVQVFNWNFPAIVAHEIMHSLGIRHEQQRPDRDTFVTIHEDNVESGKLHNFSIDSNGRQHGPYDFDSVMHYGATAFSVNGSPTITVNVPYAGASEPIGQRSRLSNGDRYTLRRMYGLLGAPTNDACLSATEIFAGQSLIGTLHGASDATTLEPTCGLSTGNADAWYRFRAPTDGVLTLTTCGTNDTPGYDLGMDTVLTVYSTCLMGFATQLACDDDDALNVCGAEPGADLDSAVRLNLDAGDLIQIRVSHHALASSDLSFVLNASFQQVNDDCALALPIFSGDSVVGTLSAATNDGAASCGFSNGKEDVWYRFTAPERGELLVNTCGTHDTPDVDQGMQADLSLHSQCSPTGAFELACNHFEFPADQCIGLDTGRAWDSAIRYDMAAGESVLIRVSHLRLVDGEFILNAEFLPGGCLCELDGNSVQVDVFDLLAYLDLWFAGDVAADVDGTPGVDVFDLLAFLDCWFPASAGDPCS